MLLVLTSPDVIAAPYSGPLATTVAAPRPGALAAVVKSLRNVQGGGHPTGVVSNHSKPSWYDAAFSGSQVTYLQQVGRQDGEIVRSNAKRFNLQPHDTIVLAGKQEDVEMAKNGGAVLVAAGWCPDRRVQDLGIKVATPADFEQVIALTSGWPGAWWFEGQQTRYSVRALSDLSSMGYQPQTQRDFGQRVTGVVKGGGPALTALLTVTARSLLVSGFGSALPDLMWGVFPSSSSQNNDSEVLSDFTHRLRTTVSKVRFCKRGEPLFIRHQPSAQRHSARGNRTDPTDQVRSLHLNPAYRGKIEGRNVVVVDDCTSYGLSFGVAAGFLLKAGAKSVAGVALGKFGGVLLYHEVEILSDPFAPVAATGFSSTAPSNFYGTSNAAAQSALRTLIP